MKEVFDNLGDSVGHALNDLSCEVHEFNMKYVFPSAAFLGIGFLGFNYVFCPIVHKYLIPEMNQIFNWDDSCFEEPDNIGKKINNSQNQMLKYSSKPEFSIE